MFEFPGVLRPVFAVNNVFNAVFGYIAHSTDVSLQLGKTGEYCWLISMSINPCDDDPHCCVLSILFYSILQNAWMYLTIGLLFLVGSSLLIHMVFFAEEFMWVPKHTKDTLFISAVGRRFGQIGAATQRKNNKPSSKYVFPFSR